jgi:hypothetical protein
MASGLKRAKARMTGLFYFYISIISSDRKLMCTDYLVFFVLFTWFWGLTCDFAGAF